jgi:hypothetical protein
LTQFIRNNVVIWCGRSLATLRCRQGYHDAFHTQ